MTGSVTVLEATPTPRPIAARPLNISTRVAVGADDRVVVGGFVITGTGPQRVILRALGPSLARLGISNPLADPFLELHGSDHSLITTNDNWKDGAQADIAATGFAPTDDRESALVLTLDPGSYTVVVSGKDGATGIGLVEAYELDAEPASQFSNLSTRGFVGTGSSVMVGGFVVGGGDDEVKMLIRVLGPSLHDAGVTEVLADPTLELRDENGAIVRRDDNWKTEQKGEIAASGMQPASDLEPAMIATLAPGSYTAIVAGKGGLTGVALLELYRLQ